MIRRLLAWCPRPGTLGALHVAFSILRGLLLISLLRALLSDPADLDTAGPWLLGRALSVPDTAALLMLAVWHIKRLSSLSRLLNGLSSVENLRGGVEPVTLPTAERAGNDLGFPDAAFPGGNAAPALCPVSFRACAAAAKTLAGPAGSGETALSRLGSRFAEVSASAARIGRLAVHALDYDTATTAAAHNREP